MSQQNIKDKLTSYKKKRYVYDLIRGSLLFLMSSLLLLFVLSALENYFWFDRPVRTILFITILIAGLISLTYLVLKPIAGLLNIRKGISDENLAVEIGMVLPDVNDKLLNYLQLSDNQANNSLVIAALEQKSKNLQLVPFESGIKLKENLKYAYWLVSILAVISLFAFINPSLIADSPSRIANFNKEFERPSPFKFLFESTDYQSFRNEDFILSFEIDGDAIPENVFLHTENKKINLRSPKSGNFKHTFKNLKEDQHIFIEASGFKSKKINVTIVPRPELTNLQLNLDYPGYTGIKNQTIHSTGSVIVPEGTHVTWNIEQKSSDEALLIVQLDTFSFNSNKETFDIHRKIDSSFTYELRLNNSYGSNKSPITYSVDVIKDEKPKIEVSFVPDTILYQSIIINGKISDDYGFSSLYASAKDLASGESVKIPINISSRKNQQTFLQIIDLKNLSLSGKEFEVYVAVRDNDQVNGPKESKSTTFFFKSPEKDELEEKLDSQSKAAENKMESTQQKAAELSKQLEKLENRLKSKKEMGWQEEKMIDKILKERQKIEKQLEELQKEHEELIQMQDKFDPKDDNLREKSEELQKLIEELMDEETKALYEELQKLLAEQAETEKVKEQVAKINKKESNLEQELERTLELFKRMKVEAEIQKTASELEKLGEKQEKLAENDESTSQKEEQEQIKKDFEDIQEKLDEIDEMNQELKNPESLSDFDEEANDISDKLQEISEEMQSGDSKKSKQKQKNAGEKMKQMAKQMQQMQSGMEMEMMQENIKDLENIVDNLVKLSFEEERLLKDFQKVSQVDPRFIELSQDQLKLIKNAEVIKDSLNALASRVAQISNFITREVSAINENLNTAMEELRERNKGKATSHQQYAMTSMNNLALLLADVLEQMQMAMSEAMGNPKPGSSQKPGLPDMSQIQKQLSEQIQELKKSGKSGKQLSEELARLAAEQSMLREEMRKLQEQIAGQPENGEASESLKEIMKQMEENETDLVNKRLSDNLIQRQEDILTKMLEATESLREQEESPEREGETANISYENLTPAFEEYLKAKQAEIELLKTIPLDLSPFYKKEVNDYFKRLSIED